jgi:hypothetical protein
LFLLLNLAVVLVSLGSGQAPAWGRDPHQNQTTASRNLTSADIEVVLATHNCYREFALLPSRSSLERLT